MRGSVRTLIVGIVIGIIATVAFYETRKPLPSGSSAGVPPPSSSSGGSIVNQNTPLNPSANTPLNPSANTPLATGTNAPLVTGTTPAK